MTGTTTGAAAGQAPAGAQPQEGTSSSGQAPQDATGQEPSDTTEQADATSTDPAILAQQLAAVRREQAANRQKLQKLEKEKADAEAAKLTDIERKDRELAQAKADNERLQHELRDVRIETATTAAAARLGFRSPEVAYRLLDRDTLEFDDNGKVKGIEAQLRQLLQKEPYLGTGATVDYGGGQRGKPSDAGKPSMNDALRTLARGGG